MSHPHYHALSSARKFGGVAEDYIAIHSWFDASKCHLSNFRHRALRHHTQGIFWAEEVFGITLKNSSGQLVPVRLIGEQHVREDMGFIPSMEDWLKNLKPQSWMVRNAEKLSAQVCPAEPSARSA